MQITKQTSLSFSCVRIIATFMIFLCHIVGLSNYSIIRMSAQFFNIGVSVFVVLSALLFSYKDSIGNVKSWYIKRFKRIYLPLIIFLIVLFAIYLILDLKIVPSTWIGYIFSSQGLTENYLNGAEHLWFITGILICYLVTPILYKFRKKKNSFIIAILIILLAIYIIIAFKLPEIFATIYWLCFEYIIGFLYLKDVLTWLEGKKIRVFIPILSLFLLVCFRTLGHAFFDGTVMYSMVIVNVSSVLIGCSILLFISLLTQRFYSYISHIESIIRYLDAISFEFYLVHYMFIIGPVTFLYFDSSIINGTMIFVISLLSAIILHLLKILVDKCVKLKEHKG